MTRSDEQFATELNALLDGLLSSFDGLRDGLAEDLPTYEASLNRSIGKLPDWLAIETQDITDLFRLENDGPLLGPRCVAMIALDVETFVSEWIGDYDAAVRLDFDDALVEEYRAHCAQIERTLEAQELAARNCASHVVETLGDWLERILEELQHERDDDERALSDLISEGSVDKGRAHRRENADVWEHYRNRAEALTNAWDELEHLAFNGVDRTVAGLETLRRIVESGDRGLADIYPELQLDFSPLEVPDRDEDAERATVELDREDVKAPTAPAEEERRTIELERIAETIEADRPRPESEFDATTDDDSSDLSEASASEPDDDLSETSEEAPEPVDEAFWASREKRTRAAIPRPEIGLVWGLPAVFFGVVIIAAIAHATGQDGAQNPFERFGWLWPICVVLGVEMIVVPIIRGWRVSDPGEGQRPTLVRYENQIEEARVTLFDDTVKIGPTIIRRGDPSLSRWEQFEPPEIGWSLDYESSSISCRETNVTRWEDSSLENADANPQSWIVPVDRFWQICDILNVTR